MEQDWFVILKLQRMSTHVLIIFRDLKTYSTKIKHISGPVMKNLIELFEIVSLKFSLIYTVICMSNLK